MSQGSESTQMFAPPKTIEIFYEAVKASADKALAIVDELRQPILGVEGQPEFMQNVKLQGWPMLSPNEMRASDEVCQIFNVSTAYWQFHLREWASNRREIDAELRSGDKILWRTQYAAGVWAHPLTPNECRLQVICNIGNSTILEFMIGVVRYILAIERGRELADQWYTQAVKDFLEPDSERFATGQFIMRANPAQIAEVFGELGKAFVEDGKRNPFEIIHSDEVRVQVICRPAAEEQVPLECRVAIEELNSQKSLLTVTVVGMVGTFRWQTMNDENLALYLAFNEFNTKSWIDLETSPGNLETIAQFLVRASPEAIKGIVDDKLNSIATTRAFEYPQDVEWVLPHCADLGRSGSQLSFGVYASLWWKEKVDTDESDTKPTFIAEVFLRPLNDFETRGEVMLSYNTPSWQEIFRNTVTYLNKQLPTAQAQLSVPTDAPKTPRLTTEQILLVLSVVGVVVTIVACIAAWLVVPQVQEIIQPFVRGAIPTLTPTLVSPTATP